ncbi:hypothetical protein QR680_002406 [Steinernema hermaphroditum]|uniref:Uncharacterized protein n=1 Tax=Steinernema hermaphroditum TaxID=289476 RepID=A0AA39H2K4_9BILA|nr:hypothetical protein QR680_002406 [Steinernema hermaphroditum]
MGEDNANAHDEHNEEMPTDTGGEDGLDYDEEGVFDVQNGIKKSETEKRPAGPMMIAATALWKSMEQNNKIKICLQHRETLRRLSSNLEHMEYTFVILDPDRHPIGRFMNNLEDNRREMEKAFKDIEEADGKLPNVDQLTADAKLLANGTSTYPWTTSDKETYKKQYLERIKVVEQGVKMMLSAQHNGKLGAPGSCYTSASPSNSKGSIYNRLSLVNTRKPDHRAPKRRSIESSTCDQPSPPKIAPKEDRKEEVKPSTKAGPEAIERMKTALHQAKKDKKRIDAKRITDFEEARNGAATNARRPAEACMFCGGPHFTNRCFAYETFEERRLTCIKKGWCTSCLAKEHSGRCHLGHVCKACNRWGHHTAMCRFYQDVEKLIVDLEKELEEDGSSEQ